MAYYFPKEETNVGYNANRYSNYNDNWGYSSYKQRNKQIEEDIHPKRREWSWGNFGSSFSFEDGDDTNLIIKDSEQYSTPRRYDIERRMKKYPKEFDANIIKDLSRAFFHNMMDDNNILKPDVDPSSMNEQQLNYYSKANAIIEEAIKKDIPGYSPLDKALFVYEEMTKEGATSVEQMNTTEALANMEEIDKIDRSIVDDKTLHDMMEMNDVTKRYKGQIFKKMSLIKHFGAKFKVEKEITAKPMQNSKLVVPKILSEFEQLPLIDKYQFALPHFKSKMALKDLNIRCPIERTEHKQKIIILVDYSG